MRLDDVFGLPGKRKRVWPGCLLLIFVLIVIRGAFSEGRAQEAWRRDTRCLHEALEIQVRDLSGAGRLFQTGMTADITEDLIFEFPEGYGERQIRIGDSAWQEVKSGRLRLRADLLAAYGKPCSVSFRAYDHENCEWKDRSFCFTAKTEDRIPAALIDTENGK